MDMDEKQTEVENGFTNEEDLEEFGLETFKDEANNCDQCSEQFESFNEVMAHIKAFHEPYCKICNVRYKCHKNLRSHKRLYHQQESESALFCEECGKKCKNKNLLNQHRSFVHKRVENLNCNLCGKSCANMAKLRKHTKKCLTREDFESLYQYNLDKKNTYSQPPPSGQNKKDSENFENKEIASKCKDEKSEQNRPNIAENETMLDYGALAFLSKEPVKSENTLVCKEESYDDEEAKGEIVEVKEEENSDDQECIDQQDHMEDYLTNAVPNENQLFSCLLCDAKVKDLKQHTKRQHMKAPEKESICEECGKIFSKVCNLRAHMKSVHSGDPRECPECGVKVLNLKQHIRRQHKRDSETGELEPESICNHCGKIFDKSSKLKGHIATVHTQNESICHICSKEFKNPHYLRCHIRVVHSSNEQVTCDQCQKTYTSKQKLYHHQRAVHTLEEARCEPCNKSYKNRDLLKKHQRLYHPAVNNNSSQLFGSSDMKNEWSSPPPNKSDWSPPPFNNSSWSSESSPLNHLPRVGNF